MVPAAPCPAPDRGGGAAGVQRLAGAEHGRGAAAQHHQQRGADHPVHRRRPDQGGILCHCGERDREGRKLPEQAEIDGGGKRHRYLVAELDFAGVAP